MEEIREAVEIKTQAIMYRVNDYIRKPVTYEEEADADNVLLDLAEKVLAVGARMPEKGDLYMQHDIDTPLGQEGLINKGRNDAIDAFTLAFAGMIPEAKETKVHGHELCPECMRHGWNACRDAIIKAIKGDA